MSRMALWVWGFSLGVVGWGNPAACPNRWVEYSHQPYESFLFPDTHAFYYRFTFKVKPDQKLRLEFTQAAESARYVNYSLYDQRTMNSLGSVSDTSFDWALDDSSVYKVPVSTGGVRKISSLRLPSRPEVAAYEIWYRVYVPGATFHPKALPTVVAYDAESGEPVACPPESPKKIAPVTDVTQVKRIPPGPDSEGRVYFYAGEPSRIFSNAHTQYLGGRFDWKSKPMAIVELSPPSFPATNHPNHYSQADVRYWSFCLGSGITTKTSGCLADYEIPRGLDGKARFLIGPEEWAGVNIRQLAAEKGLAFLERGKNFIPVVLYRNTLPREGFPGLVPSQFYWPPEGQITEEAKTSYRAENFIGELAPRGQLVNLSELQAWTPELSLLATALGGGGPK